MKHILFLVSFLFTCLTLQAQSSKPVLTHRIVTLTLVPGMGTAGFSPGNHTANFALNFLSGYSFSNTGIELSGISSANIAGTRGIQIAGIANLTGINYLLSPFTDATGEASLSGFQLAGIHNRVRDYVHGAQISGLYNRAKNLFGLQLSAVNRLSGFGFGMQGGIVYNWAAGSFDGVQAAILVNETNSRLVGLQLGAVNIAGLIEGKNSEPEGKLTAVQLGVLNFSGDMHGFQIGLVNIGRKVRGTQIGLVNISTQGGVPVNKRNGTMIGLINVGTFHTLGISYGELFYYTIFIETGTMKNGSMRGEMSNRYVTSSLEYSFSPSIDQEYTRMFGWGIHKYYYNRTTTPGMNEKRFFQGSMGMHYLQLREEGFDPQNFYGRLSAGAGYRISNKLSLYLTVRADLNYAWSGLDAVNLPAGSTDAGEGLLWPGWRTGLQLH